MESPSAPVERWLDTPDRGTWIRLRESGMVGPAQVRDLVPGNFPAYARLFHPLSIDGHETRWDHFALSKGIQPTPTMQLPDVLEIETLPTGDVRWKGRWSYQLPRLQWHEIGPLMQRHTDGKTFVVGIWEGRRDLPFRPREEQLLDLPLRRYVLKEIPLSHWHSTTAVHHCPDLVWPSDRAWFMGGDLDVSSTYVGGTTELIEEIIESAEFEAAEAHPDDPVVTI